MKDEIRSQAISLAARLVSFPDIIAKFKDGVIVIESTSISDPSPLARVSVHAGTFDVYPMCEHPMLKGLMLFNNLPLECVIHALNNEYNEPNTFESLSFYAENSMKQVSDELVVLNDKTRVQFDENECFKAVVNGLAHNVVVLRYTSKTIIVHIDYYGAEFKFNAETGKLRGKVKGGLYKRK